MIKFKSDCDITMSGFRAVLTAVKKNDVQETTSPVTTTNTPETTQSTTGWYKMFFFRNKNCNKQKNNL